MIDRDLLNNVRPWIESTLGYELPEAGDFGLRIGVTPDNDDAMPLYAVRVDNTVAVAARSEWLVELRPILVDLHPDLLFSVAGTYELSRVTLHDGVAVWGPVPCYVANSKTWRPVSSGAAVRLDESQVAEANWDVFWHVAGPSGIAQFGVYEGGELMAVASVSDKGHNIYEIGVEARPDSKGRGLGSIVVSAAGDWILAQGAVMFASAAHWNVPSGRNLRRLGMQYTYSALISWEGEFQVPPQPLGQPIPGQPVYNRYPTWAMNQDIREKP
ncbi:MAG: GNAT family N-acetyltransferase [Dehalococcoidia bacterium]|jgi:RimJ/RimL family protein N-acetyltransferase|nr:GNAT family N-acetyltransferase [Dehalococcoidia bacterium]|tara:strand:- start:1068 stop:1880 length:813 start_codon:yes stop_codon:yes gene_type:complete